MKELPQSHDAELGLIGALIMRWESFDGVAASGVTSDTFTSSKARYIFDVMADLFDSNRPWDAVTLPAHIDRIKPGLAITFEDLIAIADKSPETRVVSELVRNLLDLEHRRKLISTSAIIAEGAYTCQDVMEYQSYAEGELAKLVSTDDDQTVPEVVDGVIGEMKAGMRGEHIVRGIQTGYATIDRAFGGCLRNGGVYFVSGPAKSGKSTLSMNILLNMVQNGTVCSAASLELTKAQLVEIMMNNLCGCNASRVIDGRESVPEDLMERAKGIITGGNLRIAPSIFDIASIKAWARREVRKHGAELIWIDYVQRIRADESKQNDAMRVVSGEITALASELDLPLLVVSAINADGKLRWAGELTYDTYGTLRLEQAEDEPAGIYQRVVNVIVEDNRFGPAGMSWKMLHHADRSRFDEIGEIV